MLRGESLDRVVAFDFPTLIGTLDLMRVGRVHLEDEAFKSS